MSPSGDHRVSWSWLDGVRVLDLSRLLPGGFATMALADLGADVVKVEPPPLGDPLRQVDPGAFAAVNRNKRSVALDVREPAGRATFLQLVSRCDAVVESYRPGVLDRLDLGYEHLRAVNPRVVLCSISGFGQTGPYAQRPGHDVNFLALSGFFAVPHRLDEQVDRVGVRVGDLAGAMYAALALAVAVGSAAGSGRGQHLDVSLHEAAAAWVAPLALSAFSRADPTANPLLAGDYDLFRTADGRRVSLATFEDKFWRRFRLAVGQEFPELQTEAYDQRAERTRRSREVRQLLVRVFAARDLDWWVAALESADVPWAPVIDRPEEFLADPHVRARELVDTAGTDPPQVRFPVRFGAGLESLRRSAPALGQHTDEVLAELAGSGTGPGQAP